MRYWERGSGKIKEVPPHIDAPVETAATKRGGVYLHSYTTGAHRLIRRGKSTFNLVGITKINNEIGKMKGERCAQLQERMGKSFRFGSEYLLTNNT